MAENKPSLFKYSLNTGLICGVLSIAYYMIGFFAHWLSNTYWTLIYYLIIAILAIYYVMKFRKIFGEGYLSFNSAFNISFLIILISGTLFSAYSAIFQTYISPETGELLLREAEQKLVEKDLEPEEIESQMQGAKMMVKYPALIIGAGVFGSAIFGAIISLIVAPICRKEREEQTVLENY
ncbi:MAG: DUF4199 domain-containing protein [Bacteroidetes bacterium]|nr:DUF4199 domain-containing protein [Bacteroidota bacterium]MBP6532078.1 DUF4199 domain-containing protein [Bacteroidia bacterium]MBP6695727.1 DUF4199 domain-containing protein [Saprospiraceae bacterium]